MSMLTIIGPGLQATVQAAPRTGLRHRGVPASGPADGVSAALLSRAVGNDPHAPLVEITFGGFAARITGPATLAVGGAAASLTIGGLALKPWSPVNLGRGERELRIGPVSAGARVYLAIRGGLEADEFLGSASTYLPAGFGGHEGRALAAGDALSFGDTAPFEPADVPESLRPFVAEGWSLAAMPSAETGWLTPDARQRLFGVPFTASRQASRMGVGLEGGSLDLGGQQMGRSVPVFPGTVQCPQGGAPFILSADAQTTGGYPRVAQIIRADRHRIGQICPGDQVTLTEVTAEQAAMALKKKKAALAAFIGSGFSL